MDSIPLAEAHAHLSDLIDQIQAGDTTDVTPRGKPVARLTAVTQPRKPVVLAMLQSVTAAIPPQTKDAADLIRSIGITIAIDAYRGTPRELSRRC
jgi:antitoxin (DNA-binding transcriptional repressor) of toxin-antitoxin stability system